MKKIIIVDDEESILSLLDYHFSRAGFEVYTATDGLCALDLIDQHTPDFIILDIILPTIDGFEVCRKIRQKGIHTPILMLTARGDEFDRVFGLELGADDYMTKPFSPREVVAKVKAILRRTSQLEALFGDKQLTEVKLSLGNLEIFLDKHESYINGKLVELTPKEFELLVYLVNNKGRTLTREQLLESIWKFEFAKDSRIVDVYISHLREKIEKNTRKPLYIKTVRGHGYKMEEYK